MEEIKLIALDMDGTLLDDNKGLSQENIDAMEKALDEGIMVVPATGRTVNGVHPYFIENPRIHFAVCSNGALIVNLDTKEILYTAPIAKEVLIEMESLFPSDEILFDIFRDGEIYTDKTSAEKLEEFDISPVVREYIRQSRTPVPDIREWMKNLPEDNLTEKATIYFKTRQSQDKGWETLKQIQGVELASSMGPNIEINDTKATKGQALEWFAEYLDISMAQVMVCGDNGNDLDMIEKAGIGVAMGNAIDEVKASADVVTDTNENSGVAKAIHKYAL